MLTHVKFLRKKTTQEQASFTDKKAFIQELIKRGFYARPRDREFALLATYEEIGEVMIQKKLLLQYSTFLSEMDISLEIRDYIALLMFETELLF